MERINLEKRWKIFFSLEEPPYFCTVNQKKKENMKAILNFLAAAFFFEIAYLTMMGEVQKVIHFEKPENEMFFCATALTLGAIFVFLTFGHLRDAIRKWKSERENK